MTGAEILTLLSNFPGTGSIVGAVTGAVFSAIFLRRNTSAQEFEKIKAAKFKEVTENLLMKGR